MKPAPSDGQGKTTKVVNSTTFFLVPTSMSSHRSMVYKISTDCNCSISLSRTFNLSVTTNILREIYTTQNWRDDSKVSVVSVIGLMLKVSIKRPSLAVNLLLKLYKFKIKITNECSVHRLVLPDSKFWYSVSASRGGFPWSYEPFVNTLNATRDLEFKYLIFNFQTKNKWTFEPLQPIPHEQIEIKIQSGIYYPLIYNTANKYFRVEASWISTKMGTIKNATILNGTVVSARGRYFSTDSTKGPKDIPSKMTPCSVWALENQSDESIKLICPANFNNFQQFEEGFFIEGNSNFFHFLSESLRPLMLALEIGAIPKTIFIMKELPSQFYEVVQFICPSAKIVKLAKGTIVKIDRLSTGSITDRLSKTNIMFSNYDKKDLIITDEWRTWSQIRKLVKFNEHRTEKLYFPRQKYESRGLINSHSISKVFSQSDFRILKPVNLNFQSQVNLISKCQSLCSTSGASLLNMIFMPTFSKVLEITYPFGHSWKFLADLLDIQHYTVQVNSFRPARIGFALDSYYLSPKKLRKALEALK